MLKIINKNAPIHAKKDILINAPVQKVWELFADINRWPQWQKNITKADATLPLNVGSTFAITNAGIDSQATINALEHNQYLGWESHYSNRDVQHNWHFTTMANGLTLVTDEEAMEGSFAEENKLVIQPLIEKSKTEWLAFLKTEAEKNN